MFLQLQTGSEKCNNLLVRAACDILSQVKEESDSRYQLVELSNTIGASDITTGEGSQADNPTSNSNMPNGSIDEDSKDDLRLIESSISLRQNLSVEEFHAQLR